MSREFYLTVAREQAARTGQITTVIQHKADPTCWGWRTFLAQHADWQSVDQWHIRLTVYPDGRAVVEDELLWVPDALLAFARGSDG